MHSSTASLLSIVDDDPFVCAAMRSLVRAIGLNARVFADAIGFLDSDAPEHTRCLVCDVALAGVGGLDLLAHLARRGLSIPTLFVSGRVTAALQRRVDSTPALCLLEKPLDASELERWIRRALARSQSPPDA